LRTWPERLTAGKGVLVQTGKYQPGQEDHLAQQPTLVAKDLKAAVDLLVD
jgi:hypothetical protein